MLFAHVNAPLPRSTRSPLRMKTKQIEEKTKKRDDKKTNTNEMTRKREEKKTRGHKTYNNQILRNGW